MVVDLDEKVTTVGLAVPLGPRSTAISLVVDLDRQESHLPVAVEPLCGTPDDRESRCENKAPNQWPGANASDKLETAGGVDSLWNLADAAIAPAQEFNPEQIFGGQFVCRVQSKRRLKSAKRLDVAPGGEVRHAEVVPAARLLRCAGHRFPPQGDGIGPDRNAPCTGGSKKAEQNCARCDG